MYGGKLRESTGQCLSTATVLVIVTKSFSFLASPAGMGLRVTSKFQSGED